MLGILIIGEFLPRPPYEPLDTKAFLLIDPSRELWMALGAAVTAFAGAYVARVRFTAVAVLFNTVLFLIIVKILYTISAPVQGSPAVLTEIVGRNSAGFLVSTLAVIIGAEIGQWQLSL